MLDPFEAIRRDLERLLRIFGRGVTIPSYETEGKYKVMYHATEPENIPAIMRVGLKAPVYMMNGRSTVKGLQLAARRQYTKFGTYAGGYQVLLRIKLPKDWPLLVSYYYFRLLPFPLGRSILDSNLLATAGTRSFCFRLVAQNISSGQ